ncbi:MAG TPA: hypothetical protein VGB82_06690 [Alphaproteobacteria bacterium]
MRMPIALSAVLALAAVAACTPRVDETPPTVSYRVIGSDISDANAKAMNYCQRYGRGARMVSYAGNTATYECSGSATAAVPGTPVAPAPAPVYPRY